MMKMTGTEISVRWKMSNPLPSPRWMSMKIRS